MKIRLGRTVVFAMAFGVIALGAPQAVHANALADYLEKELEKCREDARVASIQVNILTIIISNTAWDDLDESTRNIVLQDKKGDLLEAEADFNFAGCVPGGGVRATSLRHSSPVEVTSSFRGDCHRSVLMMAQSGQGFQGHVSS